MWIARPVIVDLKSKKFRLRIRRIWVRSISAGDVKDPQAEVLAGPLVLVGRYRKRFGAAV